MNKNQPIPQPAFNELETTEEKLEMLANQVNLLTKIVVKQSESFERLLTIVENME